MYQKFSVPWFRLCSFSHFVTTTFCVRSEYQRRKRRWQKPFYDLNYKIIDPMSIKCTHVHCAPVSCPWYPGSYPCRGGRYNRYIGILRFCEKTIRTAIRFCNTGISAISGNHRLFPLTAKEKAPVLFIMEETLYKYLFKTGMAVVNNNTCISCNSIGVIRLSCILVKFCMGNVA